MPACALLVAGLSNGLTGLVLGVMVLFFCGTFLGVLLTAWAGMVGPSTVCAYVTAHDFGSALGPLIGWSIAQFGLEPGSIFLVGAAAYGLWMLVTRLPPRVKSRG